MQISGLDQLVRQEGVDFICLCGVLRMDVDVDVDVLNSDKEGVFCLYLVKWGVDVCLDG